VAVDSRYATFSPRFWAGLIDGLVFLPVSLLDNYLSSPARASSVLIAWALFSYPAYWVYSVALHACRGQTVGKKFTNVKVMDVSEQRIPSLKQALLRDIGTIVSSTLALIYVMYLVVSHRYSEPFSTSSHWPIFALGFANLGWFLLEITTMLTNSKRRAFHDLIAGTVVVRTDAAFKPVDSPLIREILSNPPAAQ
jgi:uncharacterized RDD family membrane protein YckC